MKPEISIVIPTFNRKDSLFRTLRSVYSQIQLPQEIIIVDASKDSMNETTLKNEFSKINIRYCTSPPSVCKQRNLGIKLAKSPYIFLCDDDIELPPDYISKISAYISENKNAGIITGCVLQKDKNENWKHQFRTTSFLRFLWDFIFQLSVWGDFSLIKKNFINTPIIKFIERFYQKRENTYSLAGWPLLSNFTSPVTRSSVYGLGASIIKKEWLLESPFDENLVSNGIGDNYGITSNLPYHQPIHILLDTFVWHHRSPENRLKSIESYTYRIFALHYFMRKSPHFAWLNIISLYWSLFGNFLSQIFTFQLKLAFTTIQILLTLLFSQNHYLGTNK
jgi:glycosyltransferase involved in cell wall biosynthesis